jgi:hypothetical protein
MLSVVLSSFDDEVVPLSPEDASVPDVLPSEEFVLPQAASPSTMLTASINDTNFFFIVFPPIKNKNICSSGAGTSRCRIDTISYAALPVRMQCTVENARCAVITY